MLRRPTCRPDTFLVAVTSGTSGHPRPVLRTAASWTTSFAPLAELAGIGPDDRVLLTGPLHATLHLFAAVHTLAIGAELTDRPSEATAVHAVPVGAGRSARRAPAGAPLRTAVVAGAALPADIADGRPRRGIAVTEYYGAAELSFVAAAPVPGAAAAVPGRRGADPRRRAVGSLALPGARLPGRGHRAVPPGRRRVRHRRRSRRPDRRRRAA